MKRFRILDTKVNNFKSDLLIIIFIRQVIRGFEECVKLLIEKGANLKHKDKTNKTPFHHAAISGQVPLLAFYCNPRDHLIILTRYIR